MIRAKVFLKDGNRILIPGCWYDPDESEASSAGTAMFDAMTMAVVCGLETEDEWIEIDPDNCRHITATLAGRQFAHGGVSVLVIEGPLLEEAEKRETAQ